MTGPLKTAFPINPLFRKLQQFLAYSYLRTVIEATLFSTIRGSLYRTDNLAHLKKILNHYCMKNLLLPGKPKSFIGPFKSVKSTNSEFGEMDASLLELEVSGFSSEQSL